MVGRGAQPPPSSPPAHHILWEPQHGKKPQRLPPTPAFLCCGGSFVLEGTFKSQRLRRPGATRQVGLVRGTMAGKRMKSPSWGDEVLVGTVTTLAPITALQGGKARRRRPVHSQRNRRPEGGGTPGGLAQPQTLSSRRSIMSPGSGTDNYSVPMSPSSWAHS